MNSNGIKSQAFGKCDVCACIGLSYKSSGTTDRSWGILSELDGIVQQILQVLITVNPEAIDSVILCKSLKVNLRIRNNHIISRNLSPTHNCDAGLQQKSSVVPLRKSKE
jgi:hypothetical protein